MGQTKSLGLIQAQKGFLLTVSRSLVLDFIFRPKVRFGLFCVCDMNGRSVSVCRFCVGLSGALKAVPSTMLSVPVFISCAYGSSFPGCSAPWAAVVLPGALRVRLNGAGLFARPLSCLAFLDPLCFPGNCRVGLSFSTHCLVQIGVGVLLTLGRICLLVVLGGGTRGLSVCLLPSGCLCRC